jgi:hypothetical protein
MKNPSLKISLALGLICACAPGAWASPLQRADVVADPAWVVHLDFDAFRPTSIGQYIASEMDKPEAQAKLAAFQAMFNLDLRKQLHSATLYGTGAAPGDGVLLIYGEFDSGRLVTMAKAAKDYSTSEHGGHTIHSWLDQNKKRKHESDPRTFAALQGGRLIFGQREAAVTRALDVLDGGASLATSGNFPQLGAPGTTSFIQGAARKFDIPGSDPNAAIFRLSKVIQLDIGEAHQQLSARLTLTANDEEIARNIASIAQGLLALVKLQGGDNPDAAKLANALALKQDGAVTTCTLKVPAGDFVSMMKADAERKAKKKSEHEKAGKD